MTFRVRTVPCCLPSPCRTVTSSEPVISLSSVYDWLCAMHVRDCAPCAVALSFTVVVFDSSVGVAQDSSDEVTC